ncbi:SDR family NAD(P)-dependent oxidoreductase [Winogradskya humida]|uniref:Dehydrogenase n=1 Tax=Winogradskya humida TaxID=113566 RepID=A0ABQ3ZIA7_9ACTN|nr:SDR family NAD(P)-dependent oxidoreductase [Actinoplanes humidus]GIE18311.1 dehydrogenase [Actinoplanes humidus]
MNVQGTTVLVTGASGGIGAEFARRFARRGAARVVLVARSQDKLEALAAELGGTTEAIPIVADLGVAGGAQRLAEQVRARGLRIDTLVNNAGSGSYGDFAGLAPERIGAEMQLNVVSLVELTRLFLPELVESGRGAVVNIASITAYLPMSGMAVYGATKAFVLSFTEAIWHELRKTGVTVLAVSPGPTTSDFHRVADAPESGNFETPQQVVDTAFRALEGSRRPPSVVSGRTTRFQSRVIGLVPRRTRITLGARAMAS